MNFRRFTVSLLLVVFMVSLTIGSAHAFLSEDWKNYKIKIYAEVAAGSGGLGTVQTVPLGTIGKSDYIIGWAVTPTDDAAGVTVGLYDTTSATTHTTPISEIESTQSTGTVCRMFPYPMFISNQLQIRTDDADATTEIYYIDASDQR